MLSLLVLPIALKCTLTLLHLMLAMLRLHQVKDATGIPVPPPSNDPSASVSNAASSGAMQPPTPQQDQAPDPAFIRRRYLVFVGIVIG